MNWTTEAWAAINPLYQDIIDMPFNQELMKGTLPVEKFKFYMAQDAHYLVEFGRTLSAISSRMEDPEKMLAFSQFASGAIVVERALHEGYFKKFGVSGEISPTPTCLLYTQYILNKAALANVEEAVAAVLPCFWIYKRVGDYIYSNQENAKDNPYKEWIATYAGEEFASSVESAIQITDELADEASPSLKDKMTSAFVMASKLEWMFWDSAYRLEQWEV
ncbi:thiaminase II [Pleomorphovibrio marinus]|uniref:thiaminase II n=1 Tax=Pleomorphovibrio marinus TaxID=2164132 RepID=UPI000E0AB788|nr:thiaminase II [Pleomorphovibrio marinus]